MGRLCIRFKTGCLRNKRNNLVFLVFGSALCTLLLWRTSISHAALQIDSVVYHAGIAGQSLNKITSTGQANGTYDLRRQHAIEVCREKNGASWSSDLVEAPKFQDSPIISTKHRLMYCPVGKVASSFFTRYVLAMNQPGEMTSPFDIPIENAGRGRCESFKTLGSSAKILDFLQKSTKVVFGRNPYSRIFSAYVDKLFSPNPFYWKHWGERALKLDRTMKVGKPCASEVTFPQFVRLVLFNLHKSDVHLRQVYDECHMCDVVYDVIGKLETTVDDIDYISAKINISSAFQYEEKYDFASKMDIVYDSVKSAFQWKRDIANCIPLDQMGLRIWRKLHVRGVIDSGISYPFRPGEIDNMPAEKFIAACRSAILASGDKAQLKKQKNQALLEAYSAVSEQDLQEIATTYKDDISMFGYDPKPVRIFSARENIPRTGVFNWKTDWLV